MEEKRFFKDLLNHLPWADITPNPLWKCMVNPSKTEIKAAIKHLRNGDAPGPDVMQLEALKADIEISPYAI